MYQRGFATFIYFSLLAQRKVAKESAPRGGVSTQCSNVAITRAVSCPQTSHHAQCAGWSRLP